jgi:hypothetical protein
MLDSRHHLGESMFQRILGALFLLVALTGATTNLAYAGTDNGNGNGGQNNGNQNGKNKDAPEFDPSILASGVLLLAGGLLLLNETKRPRN